MRLALVSTFIRAAPVLASWLAHHRALGFERFYLFLDDPAELALYAAVSAEDVVLVPHDAALKTQWRTLASWPEHAPFCETQPYSRQCLNADLALQLARAEGMDWLLHLDMDELLYLPPACPDLSVYLAQHSALDVICFVNHEAVPEAWHVGDYFQEVTLFKKSFHALDEFQRRMALSLFGRAYFLAYANGKSIANLKGDVAASAGVHDFKPAPKRRLELDIAVLHFTCCGFNWFHSKFATLGDFEDLIAGHAEVGKMFPMLAEGRESVVRGSMHAATLSYRDRMIRQGGLPHSLAGLMEAGILLRLGASPLEPL